MYKENLLHKDIKKIRDFKCKVHTRKTSGNKSNYIKRNKEMQLSVC